MESETVLLVIQVIVALATLGGIVPVWYRMKSGRKSEEAGTAEKLTGTAMEMVQQCRTEIAELKAEVKRLDRLFRWCLDGATRLFKQLIENNLEPVWNPNDVPEDEGE